MEPATSTRTQPPIDGAFEAPAATPIPADRARSLARWNRVLSGLHGVQFVAMLAVASTAWQVFSGTLRPGG